MKSFIYLIFFVFTSCQSKSQNRKEFKSISLADEVLVGKLQYNKFKILLNKIDYINAINNNLFPEENNIIDSVSIKTGVTLGEKNIKYYYVDFYSSEKNLHVVRWLNLRNGNLYFDLSKDEEYPYEEYYITCNGISLCEPRLFFSDNKYIWSCREILGCFSPKEICEMSVTIF